MWSVGSSDSYAGCLHRLQTDIDGMCPTGCLYNYISVYWFPFNSCNSVFVCRWPSVTGKSLDKIMELKQIAGDRNLYDVTRRQKRRQKVVDAKAVKAYKSDKAQSSGYVFDIINRKLNPHRTGSLRVINRTWCKLSLVLSCITSLWGRKNWVPALIGWGKGGNVTSTRWQVTLCDPMWHVSPRCNLLYFKVHLVTSLLTSCVSGFVNEYCCLWSFFILDL